MTYMFHITKEMPELNAKQYTEETLIYSQTNLWKSNLFVSYFKVHITLCQFSLI